MRILIRVGWNTNNDNYNVWNVNSAGYVYKYDMLDSNYAVRPVFYLTNQTVYKGGTGTEKDPFIIEVGS